MTQSVLPLVDRLFAAARLWAQAHEATVARLGRHVVNDTAFFTRLEQPGASTTTATLERFATYLLAPANWPDGAVPREVVDFGHAVGVSAPAPAASAGQAGEVSPAREQAA